MSVHHELPTLPDMEALSGDHPAAVSVYLATSPVPAERERAQVALKSAFDRALGKLEDHGVDRPTRLTLAERRDEVLDDGELWGTLSRSLAVFAAPDLLEVFVLPSRLEDETAVGTHFTLGQLWRPVSQSQEAFAVTLSATGWALWHATPEDRVRQVELTGDHPASAAEATNRSSAGRGDDRLAGDPYDLYAKRVADAARTELARLDPSEKLPLVILADEQLIARFTERKEGRRILPVPGSPDRLGASDIDAAVRDILADLNVADAQADIAELKDGDPGVVERDLAAIARQAVTGAVDTYWFDFSAQVPGTLDTGTGELSYHQGEGMFAPGVRDLLDAIASLVHERGGQVVAVRGADLPGPWKGPALAKLRFSVA